MLKRILTLFSLGYMLKMLTASSFELRNNYILEVVGSHGMSVNTSGMYLHGYVRLANDKCLQEI